MRWILFICWLLTASSASAAAHDATGDSTIRAVSVDRAGVVRWRDSGEELALYGANYCIMSGSDYRMSGLVAQDRKAMIDEDMGHFARMGWQALRLCSWGDWENADAAGNLIVNEHVDLLDYLIAAARKRGIYMLLTPIHTYDPAFADQVGKPSTNVGFSKYFTRQEMGTNPKSIAAQANYIGQLLNHVNPYTGVALKDERAIPFIELINEPIHHPEDLAASVNYINTLTAAVRATGSRQITFFNVSQDFAIAPAIQRSKVDGVSFGWYPTSLVAGHTLKGNFLQAVDAYPDMLRAALAQRPRIVYEFDQGDLLSGYLYPAMARTFRSVGAQFVTMFAYDMLRTAPYNLGWQTHYLNLVHTPRKAVSAVIAAEAMKRLPRLQSYGQYPQDIRFGDFRVGYDSDSSELNAADAFMNAGPTTSSARDPKSLRRIVGTGSSGLVGYEGTGAYFLDKVRDGVWRLELYPDQILVRDPFEQPRPDKIVSRLLYRAWPMTIHLPDLGTQFFATPIKVPQPEQAVARRAENASFPVGPGVWLLTKSRQTDRSTLPSRINRVGFDEYHVSERIEYPDLIQSLAPKEFLAGAPMDIRVRVANTALPDKVRLWVRAAGARPFWDPIEMSRLQGNDYHATLKPQMLDPGLYEFVVSSRTADRVSTFPGAVRQEPDEWPFQTDTLWTFRVSTPGAALRILNPREDYSQFSFVRPGEQYRNAFFQIVPGETADESALSLTQPALGHDTPDRYAAALYVGDAIASRTAHVLRADSLEVKLRAVGGAHKSLEVTLIEKDGAAWSATVPAGGAWSTVSIPLSALQTSRSINIPSPYPGLWNYWRASPAARGRDGDHVHIENVERLQLTVYPNIGNHSAEDGSGAAVESIRLHFPG
ncbi:MAG: rane of secreted protein [Gammaproteobacteria bacterium]|nr:rane of secreted protein [Gammaproteobacteria bacterium]